MEIAYQQRNALIQHAVTLYIMEMKQMLIVAEINVMHAKRERNVNQTQTASQTLHAGA
jgi:hypothetical protein